MSCTSRLSTTCSMDCSGGCSIVRGDSIVFATRCTPEISTICSCRNSSSSLWVAHQSCRNSILFFSSCTWITLHLGLVSFFFPRSATVRTCLLRALSLLLQTSQRSTDSCSSVGPYLRLSWAVAAWAHRCRAPWTTPAFCQRTPLKCPAIHPDFSTRNHECW